MHTVFVGTNLYFVLVNRSQWTMFILGAPGVAQIVLAMCVSSAGALQLRFQRHPDEVGPDIDGLQPLFFT